MGPLCAVLTGDRCYREVAAGRTGRIMWVASSLPLWRDMEVTTRDRRRYQALEIDRTAQCEYRLMGPRGKGTRCAMGRTDVRCA